MTTLLKDPKNQQYGRTVNKGFLRGSVPSVIATHEVSLILPGSIHPLKKYGILGQRVQLDCMTKNPIIPDMSDHGVAATKLAHLHQQ